MAESYVSTQILVKENAPAAGVVTKGAFYRPELDALRFLAFLMVFVYHLLPEKMSRLHFVRNATLAHVFVSFANAMASGLSLFFVLSAYLIATLLFRERVQTGTLNLRAFYERRILRIWPLYFSTITVAFVVCGFMYGVPQLRIMAAYLFMAGNLGSVLHFKTAVHPLKIGHLWSISVEEQFYVLFPFAARILRLKYFPALCGTILFVMAAAIFYSIYVGGDKDSLWFNSFVQFGMFAGGIMLAYTFSSRELPKWGNLLRVLIFCGGCAAWLVAELLFPIHGEDLKITPAAAIVGYLLVMLASVLVLSAVLGYSGPVHPALIYLGKISFGLYVFHIWAIYLASALLGAAFHLSMESGATALKFIVAKDAMAFILVVGMASISYRYLEMPFLKLKRKFEVIKTRPV